jgi:hypothetical protein
MRAAVVHEYPFGGDKGEDLVIMGHHNFAAPREVRRAALARMAEAPTRGELVPSAGAAQGGER